MNIYLLINIVIETMKYVRRIVNLKLFKATFIYRISTGVALNNRRKMYPTQALNLDLLFDFWHHLTSKCE